jgi:hypothetical protein
MSVVLTALVVMALSLALTGLTTLLLRRVARARGDAAMLARARFTGSARQRRTTMWMAAGIAAWGVLAGLAGGAIAATLAALSLALAGQAAVLELLSRREGAGVGGVEGGEA